MKLSKLSHKIRPSATLTLNTKAAKMKREGKNVIHLGGGEPKSVIPQSAADKAREMLDSRVVRYTPVAGAPEMKGAVIDYTKKYYGKSIAPGNIIVSSGAKQTLMVALQAMVDAGDEVIFPAPYWVSYPDMVKIAGGILKPVFPKNSDFQLTLEDISSQVTEKTKVILINSPNNPSGQIYREDFLKNLVRFAEEKGIFLISDEIYRELSFWESEAPNIFDFTKKGINESPILVVNGVSKQYAMTGFRIGWGVGAEELIAAMTRLQGHETSCPSSLSQAAAVGAIQGGDSDIEELKNSLKRKRDILVEGLSKIPEVKFNTPESTFYSFADFSYYEKDSHKLADYLIEEAEVVTVPGKEFGIDGYLRISFCGPENELREGLERIRKALLSFKG